MPCPASPEGGFHRYQLPNDGRTLAIHCAYCGQERVFRPFNARASRWTTRGKRQQESPKPTSDSDPTPGQDGG